MEALMRNVEELLLATVEQQHVIAGQEHEEAPCPAIVGMLMHGEEEYAKVLVGGEVHTREHARATLDNIQWIADKRKTKADSEERTLQEKLTRVFRGLKEMILMDGDAEELKRRAWSFGEAMKDLLWFLETVDTGVDIGNFPRTLYQGSLEPRRHMPEQGQQNDAGRTYKKRTKPEKRNGRGKLHDPEVRNDRNAGFGTSSRRGRRSTRGGDSFRRCR
jgi:hypothetical protein